MSEPVRTIAVVSQVHAGHVPAYLRHYVAQFAALGWRALPIEPPRLGLVGRLARQLDRSAWLQAARAWRGAARQVAAAERRLGAPVDAVFFVYLDLGFLSDAVGPGRVDAWFRRPWAGVVTAPRAVRGLLEPFGGREQVLAAAGCRALVVTDERFVPPCRQTWPGRRVTAMPEIADLSPPADGPDLAALRDFARGRRLVGLLGVISEKKNFAAFLALARRAQTGLPGVAFFLAGDFSPAACPGPERRRLQAVLAERPDNCALFDRPIEDGPTFNGWVAACDVVWIAYRNVFYKSNVLTKAAHFGKTALVSPGAIIAEDTVRFGLGEVIDPAATDAALAALRRLLAEPVAGRRFADFVRLNGVETLRQTAGEVVAAFPFGREAA